MIHSLYDLQTGMFVGQTIDGSPRAIAANTPKGLGAMPGFHNHLQYHVVDGVVVDWQPPQPSDLHEWDTETRSWQLSAAAREAEVAQTLARIRVAKIEGEMQPRAQRELLLHIAAALNIDPAKVTPLAVLADADTEIATLRPVVVTPIREAINGKANGRGDSSAAAGDPRRVDSGV